MGSRHGLPAKSIIVQQFGEGVSTLATNIDNEISGTLDLVQHIQHEHAFNDYWPTAVYPVVNEPTYLNRSPFEWLAVPDQIQIQVHRRHPKLPSEP